MNEFTTKKLAEIEAFGRLSTTIINRAPTEFSKIHPQIAHNLQVAGDVSLLGQVPPAMQPVFTVKAGKTLDKLETMMELYINDDWDNPTEILECTSFFAGAAAAHCALGLGATSQNDSALHQQISELDRLYSAALQVIKTALQATGESQAH